MQLRRASERGHADHGWLHSAHTFSFADYHDPAHMGFRALRVINEDRVAPGQGFGAHAHRDMEIISYVLAGELAHQDSMGNGSIIRPGEIQRMSAGRGVTHSEANPSRTEPVHFLQIWIVPAERGLPPSYEQQVVPQSELRGRLRRIGGPGGGPGAVAVHQDAQVFAGRFDAGEQAAVTPTLGRHVWLHVAKGALDANGQRLSAGDAAAISAPETLELVGVPDGGAEVLVFDLG